MGLNYPSDILWHRKKSESQPIKYTVILNAPPQRCTLPHMLAPHCSHFAPKLLVQNHVPWKFSNFIVFHPRAQTSYYRYACIEYLSARYQRRPKLKRISASFQIISRSNCICWKHQYEIRWQSRTSNNTTAKVASGGGKRVEKPRVGPNY